MNGPRLLLTALLAGSSLLAADDSKVLLMGGSRGSDGPATTALVGDMRITADAIHYEPSQDRLRCAGNVTIRQPAMVITASDCTIALNGKPTVYVLNRNGITVEPRPEGIGSQPRAATPEFKGVELYSWRDSSAPDSPWSFSLLPGTNRMKSDAEVRAPGNRIGGADELKRRIARLAPGEQVFWVYQSPGGGYPDAAVMKDILSAAAAVRVKLTIVPADNRKDAPHAANELKLLPPR